MRDFDYSQMTDKPLTEMSDRMRNWYYRKLMDMANGDKLAGKEFIKGVSELEVLWAIDFNSNGDGLILENIKNLAEKHAQAVLEDYIKNQTPVSTTYKTGIQIDNSQDYGYTIPDSTCGHIHVKIGGKEPDQKDNYGRVYSDLEGNGDNVSSAKTTAEHLLWPNKKDKPDPRPTDLDEHGCNAEGCYAWGEFLKGVEFDGGGYQWKQKKTEIPNEPEYKSGDIVKIIGPAGHFLKLNSRATVMDKYDARDNYYELKGIDNDGDMRYQKVNSKEFVLTNDSSTLKSKNRYGIGQKVFVTDQNEILECVIQEISEEDDLILYTAYNNSGCGYQMEFNLTEEEVFTTVDELLSYLHKSAEEL